MTSLSTQNPMDAIRNVVKAKKEGKQTNTEPLPVTVLSGFLGAGKTTIAKKVIEYFGCEEVVTSPTFNIVKNYKVKEIEIYHVDLYRLSSWAEFIDLDLPLNSENCLIIIEWINLIPENVVRNDQLMNASATVKKLGDAGQPCIFTPRWRVKVSPTA